MPQPAIVFTTSLFYRHSLNHTISYICDLEHAKRNSKLLHPYKLPYLSSVKRMRDIRIVVSSWWMVFLIFLFTRRSVSVNTSADCHCQDTSCSEFKPLRCSETISLNGIDFLGQNQQLETLLQVEQVAVMTRM